MSEPIGPVGPSAGEARGLALANLEATNHYELGIADAHEAASDEQRRALPAPAPWAVRYLSARRMRATLRNARPSLLPSVTRAIVRRAPRARAVRRHRRAVRRAPGRAGPSSSDGEPPHYVALEVAS
jgi:hypothetical protein